MSVEFGSLSLECSGGIGEPKIVNLRDYRSPAVDFELQYQECAVAYAKAWNVAFVTVQDRIAQ